MITSLLLFCALALPQPASGPALPPAKALSFNNEQLQVPLAVGLWGMPMPYDYDGDGITDLVVSAPDVPYRGIYFFRNCGTLQEPLFDKAVKISDDGRNYLRINYVDGAPRVLGTGVEYRDFFQNFCADPVRIKYKGRRIQDDYRSNRSKIWNYVDWDGDGDTDVVVGLDTYDDYGWDNAFDSRGRWTNGPLHGHLYLLCNEDGTLVNRGRICAQGEEIDIEGAPTPCIADFDGDGDLDIICGEFVDGFTWFRNVGSRSEPCFERGRRLRDARGEIRMHLAMIVPTPFDWDADGRPDLVVGDEDGTVSLLRNTGRTRRGMPLFERPRYFMQKADLLKFGALVTPVSIDFDGDGLQDIVAGNSAGELAFFKNLTGGENPSWAAPQLLLAGRRPFRIMAGRNGSIQGPIERKWGYTVLDVADWDGDGRLDLIINSITGRIEWLRGKGGLRFAKPRPVQVAWEGKAPKPAWNWRESRGGELVTQWRTSPIVKDWNGDGRLDLIVMDHEGYLAYFERRPDGRLSPGQRLFCCDNGSVYYNAWNDSRGITEEPGTLRLNIKEAGASGRRKLCLGDWDGDGLLDLIIDSGPGASWFRGLGTQADGRYCFHFEGDLCSAKLEGHTTCPTLCDWDADGRPELLLGAEDGHIYLIENTTGRAPAQD